MDCGRYRRGQLEMTTDVGSPIVLALDVGGTKLAAGVFDTSGGLISKSTAETRPSDGAERVLERALAMGHRALGHAKQRGKVVAAVGVSSIGITRPDRVELCSNVPGWSRLALWEAISASFPGLGIAIANDVKAATLAELWWGELQGATSGVYLNLGTGVAAGFVVQGCVVEGANGAAGEIGFWLPSASSDLAMAADGAVPLQDWLGGRAVAERASELLGHPAGMRELVSLRSDAPEVRELLDELWDGIAMVAANLAIALDPQVLVIGGGYVREQSPLSDRVRERVRRAVPYPPRVVGARFGADASLHGAAAIAYRDVCRLRPMSVGADAAPTEA
jgi:predicted NBD/HSP70 family sugar kinase